MKPKLIRGLVGVLAHSLVYGSFLFVLNGGVAQLVKLVQTWYTWIDWLHELSGVMGAFIAGIANSATKAPIHLLWLGVLIVPCAFLSIAITEPNTRDPSYITTFCILGPFFAPTIPTFIYWIIRKIAGDSPSQN